MADRRHMIFKWIDGIVETASAGGTCGACVASGPPAAFFHPKTKPAKKRRKKKRARGIRHIGEEATGAAIAGQNTGAIVAGTGDGTHPQAQATADHTQNQADEAPGQVEFVVSWTDPSAKKAVTLGTIKARDQADATAQAYRKYPGKVLMIVPAKPTSTQQQPAQQPAKESVSELPTSGNLYAGNRYCGPLTGLRGIVDLASVVKQSVKGTLSDNGAVVEMRVTARPEDGGYEGGRIATMLIYDPEEVDSRCFEWDRGPGTEFGCQWANEAASAIASALS